MVLIADIFTDGTQWVKQNNMVFSFILIIQYLSYTITRSLSLVLTGQTREKFAPFVIFTIRVWAMQHLLIVTNPFTYLAFHLFISFHHSVPIHIVRERMSESVSVCVHCYAHYATCYYYNIHIELCVFLLSTRIYSKWSAPNPFPLTLLQRIRVLY